MPSDTDKPKKPKKWSKPRKIRESLKDVRRYLESLRGN